MGYVPPSAILTVPRTLSDRARAELRAQLDAYGHRPLILEEGMTWAPVDRWTGRRLPSTFEEYRQSLYGPRPADWLPALNSGLLASLVALVVLVASLVVR